MESAFCGNKVAMSTRRQHTISGTLTEAKRNELPDSAFAFPKRREEPLVDAKHVRNALARFDQVEDVTDAERADAFANIKAAADHYGVEISEANWRDLGKPAAHAGGSRGTKRSADGKRS